MRYLTHLFVAVAAVFMLSANADTVEQTMLKVSIVVDGMMKSKSGATWMSWPDSVEAALLELPGVKDVVVDLATDTFTVSYDSSHVHSKSMQEAIIVLGYRPSIVSSAVNLSQETSGDIPELLQAALRESEERDTLVFLDFHAPWCGACRKLEETTLKDASVQKALAEFVFVKVDTDAHPDVGKHFNIVGLPTLLLIDASGKEYLRHVGPINSAALKSKLLSSQSEND